MFRTPENEYVFVEVLIISVSQIDFWNMNASILLWVWWCHIKTYYIFPGFKILLILPQASHSSSLFLVPTTSPPAVFMIIHSFRKETWLSTLCAGKKKSHYPGYAFPFLPTMLLPKPPAMAFMECLFTQHCFSTRKSLHSTWIVPMCLYLWNSLVSLCFPPSPGRWLSRIAEWPFENSVTAPASWMTLSCGAGSMFSKRIDMFYINV